MAVIAPPADSPAAKIAFGGTENSAATARASDLANRMSPAAAVLAGREADPGFTGFHRIEHGLWTKATTEGLEPAARVLAASPVGLGRRGRPLPPEPRPGAPCSLW